MFVLLWIGQKVFPLRYSLVYRLRSSMATAIRTLKTVVKPHIPMIKFPPRTTNAQAVPSKTGTVAATGQPKIGLSDNKPIGKSSRGSGIEFSEMPAKYRRRPISADEIEYIEKGGPV